ncbi:DUF4190 domain-containing protein [Microbacterium sp. NPDC019599]|uniref:DUF4190 domain-containing protein n=1 Tax=Microbacterium sp. NPDC019599 TaxID=3154690 RepID=UPI0033C8A80D
MTTPPPDGTQPPPYSPPPAYGQQPAGSPYGSYNAAPPPTPQYSAPPPSQPGRVLGIVAFVLSFFTGLIALVLGIVALVQSKKAGQKNGWAVAAIIISSVFTIIGIIVAIFVVIALGAAAGQLTQEILRQCQELGPGVWEIGGVSVDCSEVLNG